MKFHAVAIAAFALSTGAAQAAQVIGFDDLPFPGGNPLAVTQLAAGYQGFNWSGEQGNFSWNVSPNDATGWYGGTRQPYSHSGNNFAWANAASALEITVPGGGTFDLTSFWARFWPNVNGSVTAHGYRNGSETFTQTFFITGDTYARITPNFTGIDRFWIDHQITNLLIDDINISLSAVPEPQSYTLLAAGLAVMAAVSRRRRSSAG